MAEHVVCRIEPCEKPSPCISGGAQYVVGACRGCRGDGTRFVELDWSNVREIIPEFVDDSRSDHS